ncbi:ATP-binding cassette domain-containing protein [Desulfosarcina ovata]|uniref:Lipoprotein-releasing system ATP-binding protein LolD 1 n=1 Tax=Desulfosarcina ovata subsp. ovata TaxID=2752305 RepID=A0A5K8AFX3_9BACT|nr:ATP-binding cassette domain-containing protein [Desulfosarcina ovata]BBO91438.1 lipoprotein-releasing system ATP-binding protein LolD 1 [Desulfosarcina ovata subsp. ovata]
MELSAGLACRGLDFRWPGKADTQTAVLQSVQAIFAPGTINLITGETGAGKSTLLHLLAGLLSPTAGTVWADGQPVSHWPAHHRDRWRQKAGIVFQHLALIPDLSVAENLLLPLVPRNLAWPRMQTAIQQALEAAQLADLADAPAGTLSGGQRQRVAIARALVAAPRFILADEPTAFQDDRQTHRIAMQLDRAARRGAVVVVCSHDPRLRQSAVVGHRFHLAAGKLAAP